MAPNFLSKFVKNTAAPNLQGSRPPSPSNASQNPPTITIDPGNPNSPRPRRHTTVGTGSPSFDGSTESFPNVMVVPPSPRSTNYGSDVTDEDPTPKSAKLPSTFREGSAKRVPSLSNLNTPSPGASGDEESLSTPTPETSRIAFAEQGGANRPLSQSRSAGNLRGKAQGGAAHLANPNHTRAATEMRNVSHQKSQESLDKAASKKTSKNKLRSGSVAGEKSQSRHDRASSVPSIPVHNGTVTEDGVLTASPTSASPPALAGSPSKFSSTLPAIGSTLLVPDNSDAGSTYSVNSNATSSKKRRPFGRKSGNNGGNNAPSVASPAASTASLSPSRRKNTANAVFSSALAASGMAMANPGASLSAGQDLPPTPGTSSSVSSYRRRRSSDFSGGGRSRKPSFGYPTSDLSDRESYHSGQYPLSGDNSGLDDDDDDDDLDLDPDDIPVTGFAVASNRRNQDFHELFPSVPEGDYLIDDYGCALQREILIQGRIYVSENHICFHANIFGWITDLCIPMYEVTALDKRMTAFVIPNAIQVTTISTKYTFASFLSRDTTFDVMFNVWRLARPDASSMGSRMQSARASLDNPGDSDGLSAGIGLASASSVGSKPAEKGQVKNKVTQCACGKAGKHFSDLAMESVLPGAPEKIYNLMFTSGFIKDFMTHDQKLIDLQISDWLPIAEDSKLLYRQMSYTKPLAGNFGPKQTRCEIRDETVHCDFDDYVVMLTTTRTPEVPSGGVFTVKTRTCLTWASSVSTKVVVTSEVEWTGRSFIKGIIEKSCIDGQKQYHGDLERCMRAYIHDHQSEFIPEGMDASVVEETESTALEASPKENDEVTEKEVQDGSKPLEFQTGYRGLQWAYDTFEGALKVTKQSLDGLFELVKEVLDQSSSTTILYFIIAFLVISNIWTLIMVGRREEVGRRKEMKRTQEREDWVQGLVTGFWDELIANRAAAGVGLSLAARPIGDWRDEAAELNAALDQVEQRVQRIRGSLAELD
ncbi:hypothetical protein WOLCODRAFT_135716 [Wolfiporia cocos MD-104 SS10]|uniref:VASt domain-containing protein n=1 Tax=Wolfiporia cocos (strain MD-104) TaxID=742152 RepID=A0A2H3J9V6_WOLCO|nr:hypothetical protein WOLCODRAFT_135716 [Wolfiporia cocos MD-104 SS10]